MTGAFKRVNTGTLEAEAHIPPIHVVLNKLQDQSTLRMRNTGRTQEIRNACQKIRDRLGKRAPARGWPWTPGKVKEKHLEKALQSRQEQTAIQNSRTNSTRANQRQPISPTDKVTVATFHKKQWELKWETYRRRIEEANQTPAQRTPISKLTLKIREGLQKAESFLATHIRTERIGLKVYLHSRKVPGVESPECGCG